MADPRPIPYTPRAYVSPYAKQLLGIQDELDVQNAMPDAAMFTPEQLKARQNANLFDRELGLLSKLSGDKELGSFGDKLLTRSLAEQGRRITEHGEYDPMSGQLTQFPSYLKNREMDRLRREQDQTERAELSGRGAWDAAEARRAAAADLKAYDWVGRQPQRDAAAVKLQAAKDLAADGKPLTSGQMYKDLSKLGNDYMVMKELKDAVKGYEGPMGGISKLGTAADYITREASFAATDQMKKDQQAYAALRRMKEMKERYNLFGATLTGNELAAWNAVTPPRGLSATELNQWMKTQSGLVDRALTWTAESAAAAGVSKKQIEAMSHGLYKAPKSEAPAAAREPRSAVENEETAPPPVGASGRYIPGRGVVFGDG